MALRALRFSLILFALLLAAPVVQAQTLTKEDLARLHAEMDRLYQAGKYQEAAEIAAQAYETAKTIFPPSHPVLFTSMNNLAFLLVHEGRYREAEPLYRATLMGRRWVLGEDHPSTFTSLNNLADLFQAQGRYA